MLTNAPRPSRVVWQVMTPAQLAELMAAAVDDAISAGELPPASRITADAVQIERAKNPAHGDYATNLAMRLAREVGMNPRQIAEAVAAPLAGAVGIAAVDVAGPGFINVTLEADAAGQLAAEIVRLGDRYGVSTALEGQKINVEFISANPTGPLHLGHTRWAAVGDAIASVLDAAGADVTREFYVNDRGVQMDLFGESLAAVASGRKPPDDGYHGGYITDLAAEIVAAHPEFRDLAGREAMLAFREAGYALQLRQQREVLALFGTRFDVWMSERSLHDAEAVRIALDQLRSQGHVYEHDGATWLRTTDFGDDKDRVLIKADGESTYFASDCAYYVDKRRRGFDISIYLLGADHHGYVNRLKAVAACAGDNPRVNIEVLIGQLVKIMRGDREVRLSKRAGEIVTISDLVDEVGVDAARYSLIRYPADSQLTLDLDLLVKRTNDNPVFYVQYAHARICSVLARASDLEFDWRHGPIDFNPGLLSHERETRLLTALGEFPRVVASAAELREPHRVARYLEGLATAFHRFYDVCRVLPRTGESASATDVARLWLCAASRQTFANGLLRLGVSAPERM